MSDYCAFSKNHRCIKWIDYQLLLTELEEADELCHGNCIEIQHQRDYIDKLQTIMKEHGIAVPSEYSCSD